jgi:hypothetical protein
MPLAELFTFIHEICPLEMRETRGKCPPSSEGNVNLGTAMTPLSQV